MPQPVMEECVCTCIADTVGMYNICSHIVLLRTSLLGSSWYKSLKVKTWLRVRLRFVIRVSLQKLLISQHTVVFVYLCLTTERSRWAEIHWSVQNTPSRHRLPTVSEYAQRSPGRKKRNFKVIFTWQCATTEHCTDHGGGFFQSYFGFYCSTCVFTLIHHGTLTCVLRGVMKSTVWVVPHKSSTEDTDTLEGDTKVAQKTLSTMTLVRGQHAPYRLQSSL